MTYYKEHNIAPVLATKPLVTDTVLISERVHMQQISDVLDIPMNELRILNPQFRADIIPGSDLRQYTLILPAQQVQAYIVSKEQIISRNKEKYTPRDVVQPGGDAAELFVYDENGNLVAGDASAALSAQDQQSQQDMDFINSKVAEKDSSKGVTIIHKVKAGETLSSIAQMYDVQPSAIKEWNHLRRNAVRTGQQLRVTTTKVPEGATLASQPAQTQKVEKQSTTTQKKQSTTSSSKKKSSSSKKKSSQSHKVKSGESLAKIASKYGVTVNELKKANNLKGNTSHPGDKIKIPSKKKSKSKKRRR